MRRQRRRAPQGENGEGEPESLAFTLPSLMLPPHEDPRLIASYLQTLLTLGRVVVSTYDEVVALQALNNATEVRADTQMGSEVYVVTLRALTTREAAEAAGITTFDTALPQPWVDHVTVLAGDPRGHFVWSYDQDPVCGEPFPTTERGTDLLRLFCQAMATT